MVDSENIRLNWTDNIINNVVYMFSPEESIVKLKLWQINKIFYRSTKEVVPLQLKKSQIRFKGIQEEMQQIEESQIFDASRDVLNLEARQQLMLSKADIQALKTQSNPSELIKTTMGLWLLLLETFGVEMTQKA